MKQFSNKAYLTLAPSVHNGLEYGKMGYKAPRVFWKIDGVGLTKDIEDEDFLQIGEDRPGD